MTGYKFMQVNKVAMNIWPFGRQKQIDFKNNFSGISLGIVPTLLVILKDSEAKIGPRDISCQPEVTAVAAVLELPDKAGVL